MRGHLPLCSLWPATYTFYTNLPTQFKRELCLVLRKHIMSLIRVLLVDDHPEVSKRIVARLEHEKDIEVAGNARSGEEAIRMANELKPDLILIDPITDDDKRMSVLDKIRYACPSTAIVVLTSVVDAAMQVKLSKLGISSILEKRVDSNALVSALRELSNGN